ncbi:hypothetical protein Pelo_14092 [Pelomyxa schiedti]|nr:hypothetical protein Pelo_14092 [Pelomyxa schiedti]
MWTTRQLHTLTSDFELVRQPFYAKDQFVSVAWGAVMGTRRPTNPPTPAEGQQVDGVAATITTTAASCCFPLSAIPSWLLVECIGKRWVMRKERDIAVTFSSRPPADADDADDAATSLPIMLLGGNGDEQKLHFVLSSTLGVLVFQWKPGSMLGPRLPAMGEIGDNAIEVRCHASALPGPYKLYVVDPKFEHKFTSRWELLRGNGNEEPLVCWNSTWIVVGQQRERKLHVWRSQFPNQPPVKVFDWELLRSGVSMKFFGPTEYQTSCDDIEIIFMKGSPPEGILCVAHLNVRSAVESPESQLLIPPSLMFFRSSALPEGLEMGNLSRPLVARPERNFFFPFNLGPQHKLLNLHTGKAFTWLEDSSNGLISVRAVDDTHIAVTYDSNSTTSVFSLSDLAAHGTAAPQPQQELPPTCVHRHQPGTIHVAVGCGIVVASRINHSRSVAPQPPPGKKILPPYTRNHWAFHIASQHDFSDAATGSLLFSLKYNNKVLLPHEITSTPFIN